MRRFIRAGLISAAAALACAAASAHAEEALGPTLTKIRDAGQITIGHRTSSIPFSYYDANQQVVGFSQDLCQRVIDEVKTRLKKPALQVNMIPVTPQNRMTLVQNGTVDLECGVTTNLKARQQQVAFSTTFFIAGTRLLTRKDSGVHDFPDLNGHAVVTLAGTTSERILRKLNDEKKANLQIQSAKEYAEAFLVLQSGRVQAFMMDDVLLSGARTLAQKPDDWVVTGTPQSFEAYGFMMRKDDPQFKQLVDGTLSGVMKSGEIRKLYDKWFMSPVPPKNINFQFAMSPELTRLYAAPNDQAFD